MTPLEALKFVFMASLPALLMLGAFYVMIVTGDVLQ
jgi:hypothetical protein